MYFADEETERAKYSAPDYTVTGRTRMRTQVDLSTWTLSKQRVAASQRNSEGERDLIRGKFSIAE